MRFIIRSIEGGTAEERKHLEEVVAVLNKLVKTKIFKSRFFDFDFTSLQRKEKFGAYYDEVLTHEEIWNIFIEGSELANKEKNYQIDLNIEFFYRESPVLGMAKSDTNVIKLNTRYWKPELIYSNASTLIHEVAHNFGFKHKDFTEKSSIPYGLGNIVKELLREHGVKIAKGKDLVRVFKCLKYPKWWR